MSYAIECKYLSEHLSPLILQKMKEDQSLGDYDSPFFEQQYTHGSCYISLFKFKSLDQFNTPQTASNLRHLLSCGTIVTAIFLMVVSCSVFCCLRVDT